MTGERMIPGMWLYSLDDRVLNSALIESLEVIETYPDGTDPLEIESSLVEADFYEVVAVMASGDEALLYACEEQDEAFLVYDLLAALLARGTYRDGAPITEPVSVLKLLEQERKAHN